MQNAVLVGLSRQVALARELDVVANNIANLNTTGYKADGSLFEEYLSTGRARGPDRRPRQLRARPRRLARHEPGPIERTGNPLDVAIDGNGFLVVQTPRGERYTRNGSLQINATGQLVTSDGYPVLGDGGPIVLQPTDRQVSISRDGTISVREGNSKVDSARGKLRLVTFANPQQLQKDGSSTFNATGGAQPQTGDDGRRRARRGREIERARRRRDVAHDRNHPHLHPDRHHAAAAERSRHSRRSTSSPKFRIDDEGELNPCAHSAPQRPE